MKDLEINKIDRFLDLCRSFEIVRIEKNAAIETRNNFFKYQPMKTPAILKIQTYSKEFFHNGNIDTSMLIPLHLCNYIDINECMSKLLGRKSTTGRAKKCKLAAVLRDKFKTADEKVKILKEKLLSEPLMHFYGYKIVRVWGDFSGIGIIRSFLCEEMNGKIIRKWSVYYPYYKNSNEADTEILDASQVAIGLHEAYIQN